MYVYIYIINTYVYSCIHTYIHAVVLPVTDIRTYMYYINVCVYIYMYVHVCILPVTELRSAGSVERHVCVCVCACVCVCVCVCIRMYIACDRVAKCRQRVVERQLGGNVGKRVPCKGLYSDSINALLRLYEGSMKAL
jgi:hypothetical protein